MVRRGLIGQLFQAVFGVLSPTQLVGPVWGLHVAALVVLAGAAVLLSATVFNRIGWRDRLVFAAIALWIFASQLWATLAYNVGYLDVYLLAMALAAAVLLARGQVIPCAVIMILGPFAHEYFLFLVPFILAAGSRPSGQPGGTSPLTLGGLGGLSFAAAAVVVVFSNRAANEAQLASMPLDEAVKQNLLFSTLGQGLGGAFQRMTFLLFENIGFTLVNFGFYLAPALILCAGILWWKAPRGDVQRWALVMAGLFPAAALLLAWDLSRLLVMTTFTSGILFLLAAMRRTTPHVG